MEHQIKIPVSTGKYQFLTKIGGARIEPEPFFDATGVRVGVCLIYEGRVEMAVIAHSKEELEVLTLQYDCRPKKWLSLERADLIALCPEVELDLPKV